NWATAASVNDSSDKSFWAWTLVQVNTLRWVAFALVCAAAFIILNSLQVLVVLAGWNGVWALDVFAISWDASVLSTTLIDNVDTFAFSGLASSSLVTTFSLGGSDIVDSATSVDSAWIVLESPALTVGSFTSGDIDTDDTWSEWSDVGDWSLSDGLGGSAWCSSGNVWGDGNTAASSDWAASVGIDNSSSVSGWASLLTEVEALILVAFARILVAAAVSIDWSADEVLVAFASWALIFWALWALLFWDLRAEWSSATLIDRVSSALEGTLGTLLDGALSLRALNVSGSDTAAALTLRDRPLLTIASWLTFMINTDWWFSSGGDGNTWCGGWWSLGGSWVGTWSSSTVGNWSLGSVLAWDALGNWAALVSGDDLFVTLWALSLSEIAALALVTDARV
ncbi:MAG: hypothetical protein VXW72_01255, partial [Candidatus Thermoplasmatota archaeon]|nr:hypothetical protein [Candidatus Thermoplasmatota archaeon]